MVNQVANALKRHMSDVSRTKEVQELTETLARFQIMFSSVGGYIYGREALG